MITPPPIRVLLLDVNAETGDYLARAPHDILLVGIGCSAQVIELCVLVKPDLVMLEVFAPDSSALDTIRAIRVTTPQARVFILSTRVDISFARSALNTGATGFFILDGKDKSDLITALRAVARGRIVLSPAIAYALIDSSSAV